MAMTPLLLLCIWLVHEHLHAWLLIPLQMYPVLVSAIFLSVFGYSLISPPPIIERIARLSEPDLPPSAIIYTRRVTQVWCLFFIINGSISLGTVFLASPTVWYLYNGVVSYLLIGLLFGAEYLVRLRFKRRLGRRLG